MSDDYGKNSDENEEKEGQKSLNDNDYEVDEYKVHVNKKKRTITNEEDDEDKYTRLNFTLPKDMKDNWKKIASDVSKSVSQLIRDGVSHYIDELTQEIGIKGPKPPKPQKPPKPSQPVKIKIKSHPETSIDKERLKQRIQGLIRIYHNIPLDKLATALNISKEQAENYIFELVARDIDGTIKEEVFIYTDDDSKVIYAFRNLIDEI